MSMVSPDLVISGSPFRGVGVMVDRLTCHGEAPSNQPMSEGASTSHELIGDSLHLWEAAFRSSRPDLLLSLMGHRRCPLNAATAAAAAMRLASLCHQPSERISYGTDIITAQYVSESADMKTPSKWPNESSSPTLRGYDVLSFEHKGLYQRFILKLSHLCALHTLSPCDGFASLQAVRLLYGLARMRGHKCGTAIVTAVLASSMYKLQASESSSNLLATSDDSSSSEINSAMTALWVKRLPSWQCLDLCWALATLR